MKTSYFKSVILQIISFSLIMGCSDETENSTDSEPSLLAPSPCLESEAITVKNHQLKTIEYDDNPQGQLYLSADQEFILEDKTYNFLSIYTEENSKIHLAASATSKDSIIELNSIGSCDFHGDIILSEFTGTLILNCYSQLNLSGTIELSSGNLILKTPLVEITYSSDLSELQNNSSTDGSITLGDTFTIISSPSPTLELGPIESEPLSLTLSECTMQ